LNYHGRSADPIHLIHPIHPIHHILPIPSILSIPSIPFISSFHLLLGVIMICICEPRDASARSFNRLRSVHTIMIFVVPASTDHLLWTMAIKTPDAHNHSQETERDQLGVTRKSPEPFSASGWLPVRIALPDHCRRGWAPINQRAHIILLWELISVSRSAHFRFATLGLSKHPRTMCTVLSQVVSCHGGLLFMSLLQNHQRTHWNVEITLCHAC
jgi:hypothetical protein